MLEAVVSKGYYFESIVRRDAPFLPRNFVKIVYFVEKYKNYERYQHIALEYLIIYHGNGQLQNIGHYPESNNIFSGLCLFLTKNIFKSHCPLYQTCIITEFVVFFPL
jgi:hypothetical protein